MHAAALIDKVHLDCIHACSAQFSTGTLLVKRQDKIFLLILTRIHNTVYSSIKRLIVGRHKLAIISAVPGGTSYAAVFKSGRLSGPKKITTRDPKPPTF